MTVSGSETTPEDYQAALVVGIQRAAPVARTFVFKVRGLLLPAAAIMAALSYDPTHRLTGSVATGNATHNLTFSYDRYGNMTCQTNGQTQGPCPNYAFSASTNQVTTYGFTYDAGGTVKSREAYSAVVVPGLMSR